MTTHMRLSEIETSADAGSKSADETKLEWSAVEACRQYLTLIARREISPSLRAKECASDLVQETMMVARRKLATVRFDSTAQLQAWLKRILINKLKNFRRTYLVLQKQNLGREVRYEPGGALDPLATTTAPPERASRGELRRCAAGGDRQVQSARARGLQLAA